jgi:hypothetical protein
MLQITKQDNKQEIIKNIYDDWGKKPQYYICISIFEYLLKNHQKSWHLTYASLKQVVNLKYNNKYNDEDILIAIQYLCGYRTHLLEIRFELIEDNEEIFDIPNEEIKRAEETGKLVHPETGEFVENYQNKVYMYFVPSSVIQNIII